MKDALNTWYFNYRINQKNEGISVGWQDFMVYIDSLKVSEVIGYLSYYDEE